MTTETETNRGARLLPAVLPWLLGAVMFSVYLLTLDHGVTPANVASLTRVSGHEWDWRPEITAPLTFLLTYPLKWLPANLLPFGLNVFAAACAALSLVLLARSVMLLPHDRTEQQRVRQEDEFSLLSIPARWLPPALAVLVCGLQMTFWEQSVVWTGEMLDLLLFAYVIRCLLEFRVSQRESWILRAVFVYGLGMANNWAMVGFFPLFVGALIWIRGVTFFNPRILLRTLGCGLLGVALIFVLPLMISFSDWPQFGFGFWDGLRYNLASDKRLLLYLGNAQKNTVALLALTSLLPVFILSLRWASSFGDTSPLGIFIATATLNIVQGLFFLASLWVALDCQISPRHSIPGISFLTFYYLAALSIGYFSGYFLLVFGKRPGSTGQRAHPLVKLGNVCVVTAVCVLAVAVPATLVAKNLPDLRARKATTLAYKNYISEMERSLPPQGGVILSDDPARLHCLEATLSEKGDKRNFLFIETGAMGQLKVYVRFLEKKYPNFDLSAATTHILSSTNAIGLPPESVDLIKLLDHLAETKPLCYLHPSFGYYFERFYLKPRGVLYPMQTYASNVWMAPPLTDSQIAGNQEFWSRTSAGEDFHHLLKTVEAPEHPTELAPLKWLEKRAHLTHEPDGLALSLAIYYSRALDYWGVELQKRGRFADAAKCFEQSQQLNPENVPAKVNLECNKLLQAGKNPVPHPIKGVEDKFGKMRGWSQIMEGEGPFDDPSYCLELATTMTRGGNYRQAIQQFERARELSPDSLIPALELAQMYIWIEDNANTAMYKLPYEQGYADGLNAAEQALRIAPDNVNGLFFKGIALMKLGSYEKAIEPLNAFLTTQTNNYMAVWYRAIAYLQQNKLDEARRDYETLVKVRPKAYQIDYGLGEIAYRRKEKTEAIRWYEAYLTNAPASLDEAKLIRTRLKELKTGAP